MLTTSLRQIKQKMSVYKGGIWNPLMENLDSLGNPEPDTLLKFEDLIKFMDFFDGLTVLSRISSSEGHENSCRLFACFCGKVCLPYCQKIFQGEKILEDSLKAAEDLSWGRISEEESLKISKEALDFVYLPKWDIYNDMSRKEHNGFLFADQITRLSRKDVEDFNWIFGGIKNLKKPELDKIKKEFNFFCQLKGDYGTVPESPSSFFEKF